MSTDIKEEGLKTSPGPPVPPVSGFSSPLLPAWMYGDPADVAERLELQAAARAARQAKGRRRPEEAGLTPGTVRAMRRLRIRGLVEQVLKGEK